MIRFRLKFYPFNTADIDFLLTSLIGIIVPKIVMMSAKPIIIDTRMYGNSTKKGSSKNMLNWRDIVSANINPIIKPIIHADTVTASDSYKYILIIWPFFSPIARSTPNSHKFSLTLEDIDIKSMKNEIQSAIQPIKIVNICSIESTVKILSSIVLRFKTSVVLSPTTPLRLFLDKIMSLLIFILY